MRIDEIDTEVNDDTTGIVSEAPGANESIVPDAPESDGVSAPDREPVSDDPKPGESARESAKRAFDKLSKEDGVKSEDKVDPKLPPKLEDIDPELLPPERLRANERAMFNNLPKGLKRAFHRAIKDTEAGSSRIVTESQKAIGESRYITEAVQPFAASWGAQGFSVSQGIVSLAAAQEKLTNPETSYKSYIDLGVDLGHIKPEQAQQLLTASQGQNAQNYQDPQVSTLQQRLDALEYEREQERVQLQAQPIIEEMRSVADEVDPATGRFRYPELQNGDYLLSLRPRIEKLQGYDPTLSHGEALRQANEMQKADQLRLFGYSPQATSQIRPLATNNQVSQRAAQAAVTVRGKTSITTPGQLDFNPPPEALKPNDARATARWAYEQLSRG